MPQWKAFDSIQETFSLRDGQEVQLHFLQEMGM